MIDLDRFQRDPAIKESTHHLGRLDQHLVVAVRPHLGPGFAHDLGAALRVIPMTVRQPELGELALLAGQNRSYVRPDIARRVDEERLSALGRSQQIRVGLDRPGGQHMQVHAVNPRAFPRRAIVKTPGHFPWTVFAKTRPARSPVTLPPSRATRPFTITAFMPSEW